MRELIGFLTAGLIIGGAGAAGVVEPIRAQFPLCLDRTGYENTLAAPKAILKKLDAIRSDIGSAEKKLSDEILDACQLTGKENIQQFLARESKKNDPRRNACLFPFAYKALLTARKDIDRLARTNTVELPSSWNALELRSLQYWLNPLGNRGYEAASIVHRYVLWMLTVDKSAEAIAGFLPELFPKQKEHAYAQTQLALVKAMLRYPIQVVGIDGAVSVLRGLSSHGVALDAPLEYLAFAGLGRQQRRLKMLAEFFQGNLKGRGCYSAELADKVRGVDAGYRNLRGASVEAADLASAILGDSKTSPPSFLEYKNAYEQQTKVQSMLGPAVSIGGITSSVALADIEDLRQRFLSKARSCQQLLDEESYRKTYQPLCSNRCRVQEFRFSRTRPGNIEAFERVDGECCIDLIRAHAKTPKNDALIFPLSRPEGPDLMGADEVRLVESSHRGGALLEEISSSLDQTLGSLESFVTGDAYCSIMEAKHEK